MNPYQTPSAPIITTRRPHTLHILSYCILLAVFLFKLVMTYLNDKFTWPINLSFVEAFLITTSAILSIVSIKMILLLAKNNGKV